MNMTTLFDKLEQREIELKRLTDNKEGDKKKKSLALKVEEEKDSDSNGETPMEKWWW